MVISAPRLDSSSREVFGLLLVWVTEVNSMSLVVIRRVLLFLQPDY